MFNRDKDRLEFLTDVYGKPLEEKTITDEEKRLYPKYAQPYVQIASLDGKVRGIYAYVSLHYEEESDAVITGDTLWHDCVLPVALALKRGGIEEVFISRTESEGGTSGVLEIGIFLPFDIIKDRRDVEFFLNEAFSKAIRGMVGNIFQITEGMPVT